MYEVRDKVVFVTGAAAGIGAGIVKAFLDDGAKVRNNLLRLFIIRFYYVELFKDSRPSLGRV